MEPQPVIPSSARDLLFSTNTYSAPSGYRQQQPDIPSSARDLLYDMVMHTASLRILLFLVTITLAAGLTVAQTTPKSPHTPAELAGAVARSKSVDYAHDVKPILTEHCFACHGNGMKLGGLQLDDRDALLNGGQSGPAVAVGNSAKSLLIKLVSGADPSRVMPARGRRLTAMEIAVLSAWIDQGVKFAGSGTAAWSPQLAPRHPAVPPAKPALGLTNPIDRLLQPYFRAHRIQPGPLVDERTYARRVYLDLIGLLPTPEELHAFFADRHPNKRALLVRRLLADKRNYAEHWITFWNDMLRNDFTGTGYIDGGRKQITGWLYAALEDNMPYDRFVAQLVNPTPECAGFINGIVWRGVVNASQTPQMQAAQNISQVFMGINLKCASCHNSFISTWKLSDAYGLAGVYADHPLEMVRCDKPTGQVAPIKFLYPELGTIGSAAPREKRLAQLATILTSSKNGRLARTLVNRLWQKLLGRGLVEPTDEMDNRPWDPDLLDWLASDFADNGFDVKRTIEEIVMSRAYQLPAMSLKSEQQADFVFAGPAVKRMTAEQFVDSVSQVTGVWQRPAVQYRIDKGRPVLPASGHPAIRFQSGVMRGGAADVDVDVSGAEVLSLLVTDAGDGANFDWADWVNPRIVTATGEVKLTSLPWVYGSTGYGSIQLGKSVVEKPLRLAEKTYADGIGTHANSIISYLLPPGASRFRATVGPDAGALEEKGSTTSVAFYVLTGERSLIQARAALAEADRLMRALGRPNRDQVVTERSPVATTLQALELTNGQTLASDLDTGAMRYAKECGGSTQRVVNMLYERCLGRPPTPAEYSLATDVVGSPARSGGIEDLLWSLVMLPEFQLVY